MSRSESDDDEFESADEGDEAVAESSREEECTSNGNIPVVQTEPTKKIEEILKEAVQETPVAGHVLADGVGDAENTKIPVNNAQEFLHRKGEDVSATTVEDQIIHDYVIPHLDSTLNKIPTDTPTDLEACQEDERSKTTKLQGNGATGKDTDSVRKIVNETILPVESFSGDDSIPLEIVNKISTTRNVSNRGKIRSKPTLGAKKLGAVKLPQPNESPGPALAKVDSKELLRETVTSTAQEASTAFSSGRNDDGWGWFAPPKSLMSSVASLTNQILSTVENGLNIPEPEDLAKAEMLLAANKCTEVQDKVLKQTAQEEKSAGLRQLFGGVSNITKFVEDTGSSLFSTGLDTLELLGKKTINVLQQSDPGLKRTKAVLANPIHVSQDRPCLSQVLRQAKIGEMTKSDSATGFVESTIPKLSSLFEFRNGIVHLEALEMLSQQCQNRIAPQIRRLTSQRKAVMDEIAVLCSRTDDSEDIDCSNSDMLDLEALETNLSSYFDRISLELPVKKFINAFRQGILDTVEVSSPLEVYRQALDSLALVTSLAVELIRKGAEFTLMASKPSDPAVGARLEAETFRSVASLLAAEISKLGSHHADQLIWTKTTDQTNYATDIYYEASNCRGYLENALKFMTPVLQSRVF